jgi:CDGSH-type Zn-finger protein
MPEATATQNAPYPVQVEAGKTYYYCSCGKSAKQPFCDGTHKGSEFKPTPVEATESKQLYFCGCRKSAKSPFCDGTHKKL